MRVLIFGGRGMLGHKLVQVLGEKFEVFATIRGDFSSVERFDLFKPDSLIEGVDVADILEVENTIAEIKPDVVINAIGIVKQLPSSKDVIQTLTINSIFPHQLSAFSDRYGFRLITVSTDCVFSGARGNYSENDIPEAVDLYGRSKQLGEVTSRNCLTIRTSIIGRELGTSHSLIDWFVSNKAQRVNGFVHAIYSGFPTLVFADIISMLLEKFPDLNGLYHVSSDPINKFDLLNLVNERLGLDIEIERFADFRIDRSLDSTQFRKATGFQPESWPEMIDRMASDPTPYEELKG